jgi:hypothetical protein
MATYEDYQKNINNAILKLANDPDYLNNLKNQALEDDNLSKDELDATLVEISLISDKLLIGGTSSGGVYRPESLFPSYSFLDDSIHSLPCGLAETNRDKYEKYSQWLVSEFLPTFHPLPRGDLQYPVIACTMLCNSQAMSLTQKLLIIWIQGLSGCGKSNLLESYGYHYPEKLIVRASPSITGAALRDEIDGKIGRPGNPGILLWDNFWVRDCLEKIKDHRDILLMNSKQSAKSNLSTKGDNNQREFRTHCLKILSTIDDGKDGTTQNGMSEITRRLWIITCKNTGSKPLSRDLYSWDGMRKSYDDIWGHANKEAIIRDYAKCLKNVQNYQRDKIPFDAKVWEILITPLAVWQFVGLGTLQEGIDAFYKHRQWTYTTDTAQIDILLQTMRDFMDKYEEKAKRLGTGNPLISEAKMLAFIDPNDIKQHIESVLPMYSVNSRLIEEKIVPIMQTFGYLHKVVNGKAIFSKL